MSITPARSGLLLSATLLSTAAVALAGCAGENFSACDGCGDAAAGSSGTAGRGGTAGSGGSSGSSGRGGSGGVPDAGGAGGSGGGGTAGSGMTEAGERFPRTRILDDFSSGDGAPQSQWIGNRAGFSVVDGELGYVSGPCNALLWDEQFGVEQEVFATLASINPQADEINVVLKAQGPSDCELLEILYGPDTHELEIHYCTEGTWHLIESIGLTLETGDQLGARFLANEQLHVFVNGIRTTIFDVSEYPHAQLGGRIGVNCEAPADGTTAWDDFGGG